MNKVKSNKMPIIPNCKYFPSPDYIEHSFGNKLCEHVENKSKLCNKNMCPIQLEILS